MSTYDHYVEARAIADEIETDGFVDQAEAVRAAIDEGRSGTEIFMQLRFYLAPLAKHKKVSSETRYRIVVLVDKINEALNR